MDSIFEIIDSPNRLIEEVSSVKENLKTSIKPEINSSGFEHLEEVDLNEERIDFDSLDLDEVEEVEVEDYDEPNFKSSKFKEKNKESTEQKEPSAKNMLNAKLSVGMYDMLISQAGKMLSGNFEDDKFKLPKKDKQEIAYLWASVMEQSDKEYTPESRLKKMLTTHALIVLLPLLVGFVAKIIKKRRESKKDVKKESKNEYKKEEKFTDFKDIVKVVKNDSEEDEIKESSEKINKPKSKRGRKKGAKKNPETGKMEYPFKIEEGVSFYSWGAEIKNK